MENLNWSTLVLGVVSIIIVVVGAIVTIVGDISFDNYAKTLAGLGIGVGVYAHGQAGK